jgi:LuxR family maltose regulon positive regulatory protein
VSTGESNSTEGGQRANQLLPEQREPLLRTKLFVPPMRAKRVDRPGLIERMNDSQDKALILVSAPAGFGKTTLLAEWAAQAGMPVAWLSLDASDNDANRFIRYLIAALETAFTEQKAATCVSAKDMIQSVQPLPIHTILVAFINDLTDITEPFALVLDDYQFITSPAVNEALTFILERLPPQVHLVIASRFDPSIPLHRLRAAQRLLEIRTDDLRFSREETNTFINAVMALSLSREDVSTLRDRTEGWIVGLQMAALSMQGIADRPAFVQAFSGSHRYILEYLIEEVLSRQPESLQSFLLQTSILERLCAPLCNEVLGDRGDSQAILEQLDRYNIFLTPLDQVGYWYRYHHLFADLLRARLQRSHPERLHTLHLRASQWYEEAELPEEAIGHAFTAKEIERAALLVERYALNILSRGEMSSLLGLFATLPEDLIVRRPGLCLLQAWAFTFSGQFDKVEPQLQEIEGRIKPGEPTHEVKEILGSIAIIRGLIADYKGEMTSAIELAWRADELLPEEKWAERSIISFVLGDGYSATGELDKAEQAFEKIFQAGRKANNLWTLSVALHKLALLKKLQGKLRSVEARYQEAIQLASERGGKQYGSLGATYVGLSDLLRERNELDAARQMVVQAIQNMERWQNPTDLVNGYVTLARISLSQGEIETAQDALGKAGEISRQGNIFPITRETLEACQVRLWLAIGDLAMVDQWMISHLASEKQFDGKGSARDRKMDFLHELEWITMARVFITRNELDRALHALSILAEAAESAGRYGRTIEIILLTALALYGSGKRDQALNVLTKSLELAEPEGYVRIFLDEGRPMEELLRACSRRVEGTLKTYIDKLLKAFSMPLSGEQAGITTFLSKPEPLIEPLTGREAEVLRLLTTGLSNQEIAERLYLSEGTVKTHTHNLYGKLGVQSRTRAIARAKELNLI